MGFRQILRNFALFAKQKSQTRALPNYNYRPTSYNNTYSYSNSLTQLKDAKPMIELNQKKTAIYTPDFRLYNNLYNKFPEVSSICDKIAERIIGIGGKFINENNEEMTPEVDFSHTNRDFLQNMLIFGQTVAIKAQVKDEERDLIIPSHQISNWRAEGIEIDSFDWNFESSLKRIEDDFYLFRNSNTDSMFFGKSKLLPLYEVLNTLHLDREAFNLFLENNSFPGLVLQGSFDFGSPTIDANGNTILANEERILQDTLKDLNSREGRYKAVLLPESITKIEQIKQEISSKLSSTDYENILKLVCFCYGYPYGLLQGGVGLGQGEQKSQLIQLRDEVIKPLQNQLAKFINYLLKKNSDLKDVKWIPNEMEIESKSDIMESGIKLFTNGIINGKTLKSKYLGYDELELTPDDDYRIIAQNINLIKEGQIEQFLLQNKTSETVSSPVNPELPNPNNLIAKPNQKKPKFFFKIKSKK